MAPIRLLDHALVLLYLLPASLASFAPQRLHNDVELDKVIGQYDAVMVNYGTSWCGHCKMMNSAYAEAADFLKEHNILLATVDCTDGFAGNAVCEDIFSYPTLRVHRGDKGYVVYTGGRQADDLIRQMTDGKFPIKASTTSLKGTTAYDEPTRIPSIPPLDPSPVYDGDNIVFVSKDGKSAAVKLALPGLTNSRNADVSSAAILEFTFSKNGKHLLLNDKPIALQVPNPSVPAALTAAQVDSAWNLFDPSYNLNKPDHRPLWSTGKFTNLELDYELYARSRDDPNIRYHNYWPVISVNLIGARLPHPPSFEPTDFLLDSLEQKIIEVQLEQLGTRVSDDPKRTFRISTIKLLDRPSDYRVPHPSDFECSPWSWRCSDVDYPPWYRFIWRANFDEDGRISCLRWKLLQLRWEVISWLGSLLHYSLEVVVFLLSPWMALWIPFVVATGWAVVFLITKRREQVATVYVNEKDREEKEGLLR